MKSSAYVRGIICLRPVVICIRPCNHLPTSWSCSWRALGSVSGASPKSLQDGPNIALKWLQIRSQIAPTMAPKWLRNGSRRPPGVLLAVLALFLPLFPPYGPSWSALGSVLESSGELLEESGEPLERAWSSPGSPLDPPGDVLRAPGDLLEASRALLEPFGEFFKNH